MYATSLLAVFLEKYFERQYTDNIKRRYFINIFFQIKVITKYRITSKKYVLFTVSRKKAKTRGLT